MSVALRCNSELADVEIDCQTLPTQHGGRIWAEAAEAPGTRSVFLLPRSG